MKRREFLTLLVELYWSGPPQARRSSLCPWLAFSMRHRLNRKHWTWRHFAKD